MVERLMETALEYIETKIIQYVGGPGNRTQVPIPARHVLQPPGHLRLFVNIIDRKYNIQKTLVSGINKNLRARFECSYHAGTPQLLLHLFPAIIKQVTGVLNPH